MTLLDYLPSERHLQFIMAPLLQGMFTHFDEWSNLLQIIQITECGTAALNFNELWRRIWLSSVLLAVIILKFLIRRFCGKQKFTNPLRLCLKSYYKTSISCGMYALSLMHIWFITPFEDTGHNGQKPKGLNLNGQKPKRPQTGTATDRNGHKPKRTQTGTATDRNGHKPKRPQTGTATNIKKHNYIWFSGLQICVLKRSFKLVSQFLQKGHSMISEHGYGARIWTVMVDSLCAWVNISIYIFEIWNML